MYLMKFYFLILKLIFLADQRRDLLQEAIFKTMLFAGPRQNGPGVSHPTQSQGASPTMSTLFRGNSSGVSHPTQSKKNMTPEPTVSRLNGPGISHTTQSQKNMTLEPTFVDLGVSGLTLTLDDLSLMSISSGNTAGYISFSDIPLNVFRSITAVQS